MGRKNTHQPRCLHNADGLLRLADSQIEACIAAWYLRTLAMRFDRMPMWLHNLNPQHSHLFLFFSLADAQFAGFFGIHKLVGLLIKYCARELVSSKTDDACWASSADLLASQWVYCESGETKDSRHERDGESTGREKGAAVQGQIE